MSSTQLQESMKALVSDLKWKASSNWEDDWIRVDPLSFLFTCKLYTVSTTAKEDAKHTDIHAGSQAGCPVRLSDDQELLLVQSWWPAAPMEMN